MPVNPPSSVRITSTYSRALIVSYGSKAAFDRVRRRIFVLAPWSSYYCYYYDRDHHLAKKLKKKKLKKTKKLKNFRCSTKSVKRGTRALAFDRRKRD